MRILLLTLVVLISVPLPSFAKGSSQGDYVVLLHGIARTSKHMKPLEVYLGLRGYRVINLDYPSVDYELDELTDLILETSLDQLDDQSKVHWVGYSMGGLLVHRVAQKFPPRRLGRVVQLAAPNQGSEMADFLERNWLYQFFAGPAGQQLTTGYQASSAFSPKLNFELGVIAGNRSIDPLSSVIVPGEDDGKVAVARTKIFGMKDHVVVPANHTFFPGHREVLFQTAYFLAKGRFYRKGALEL